MSVFEVGSRIEITERYEGGPFPGAQGVVVVVHNFYGIGVLFDKQFENGHTLEGNTPEGYGYWIDPSCMKLAYPYEDGLDNWL